MGGHRARHPSQCQRDRARALPIPAAPPVQPIPRAISCDKTTGVASVATSFGAKKIGLFASVALLMNNITGPGVPQLPNLFAEAGWLTPVLCVVGEIWKASVFPCCSTHVFLLLDGSLLTEHMASFGFSNSANCF